MDEDDEETSSNSTTSEEEETQQGNIFKQTHLLFMNLSGTPKVHSISPLFHFRYFESRDLVLNPFLGLSFSLFPQEVSFQLFFQIQVVWLAALGLRHSQHQCFHDQWPLISVTIKQQRKPQAIPQATTLQIPTKKQRPIPIPLQKKSKTSTKYIARRRWRRFQNR